MICELTPCDFSECDVLALSALATREISKIIKDADALSMVADMFSSIGDNLTLVAGQRARCFAKPSDAVGMSE